MRFETNSIPPRFSKGGRDRVKVGRAWMLDDNVDWRKAIEIESRVWKLELFTRLPSFPVIHGYEGGGNGENRGRKSFGESRVTGGFCMQLWVTALLKAIHSAYKLLIFLRQKVGRRCAPESWLFGTSCRDKSRRTTPLKFDGQLASWDGILFLAS